MITTTSTIISEDGQYVVLTLSNGEESNITTTWASEFVQEAFTDEGGNLEYRNTEKSLLEYEIEQAPIRAQAREDKAQQDRDAAEAIINAD